LSCQEASQRDGEPLSLPPRFHYVPPVFHYIFRVPVESAALYREKWCQEKFSFSVISFLKFLTFLPATQHIIRLNHTPEVTTPKTQVSFRF
jgi:hypothetical protein